ncbi:MAG: hypothetical protein AAFU85_13095 [Planctomycetota bacterium]
MLAPLLFLLVSAIGLLAGFSMFKTGTYRRASRDRLLALFEEDESGDVDEERGLVHDPHFSPFASGARGSRRSVEDGNPYRAPQER